MTRRRILALAGGGVRGIIEVAYLQAIEAEYRRRHGPRIQLCDIFDLVGGTSTGALVATSVAAGLSLDRVADFYVRRAAQFFGDRAWWRLGTAPVYDAEALKAEIIQDIGDITIGDPALRTHLAIILRRMDTGSTWIVNNIPSAPYFDDPEDGAYIGNKNYHLASLLVAATAAPTLFAQQSIRLSDTETGVFLDGGLSAHSAPSLALLKLARVRAFGLNWPTGPEALSILSIGTGRYRNHVAHGVAARLGPLRLALHALMGLTQDVNEHTLMLMEWMGQSKAPSFINSEVGHLGDQSLAPDPLFSFLHLDLPLETGPLRAAGIDISERDIKRFRRFDDPAIIAPLYTLTQEWIGSQVDLAALLD